MKLKAVSLCLVLFSLGVTAKQVSLDRVAVIVDQGVVLESEIKELVSMVKRNAATSDQKLPSDKALRTQAIERLILSNLQLQLANRMGIQISDPQLDQTIANMAQQNGISVETLRNNISRDGVSFEVYREDVRKELITGEVVRANVRRRVYITPQEIANLVKLIDEQGAEQAEYNLGHILIGLPAQPNDEDVTAAQERATKVLELLNNGSNFERIAIASSSGAKALDGGDMGWLNINSMPTLFAEAVVNKSEDELVGPIRSGAGFHILKVKGLRGIETVEVSEVNSRHILIKPSVILSEDKAEKMLLDFKQKVLAGEADFAELAKEHSEDPGSALRGGELGWSDPEIFVVAFKNALARLDKGELSEPFRSSHGWHIVEVIGKRVLDATDKLKEEKAYQLIFNRRFTEEKDTWLREMRDTAYIEVLDQKSAG